MHFEEDMGCLVQNIATSLLDLMLAKFMLWCCCHIRSWCLQSI